MFFEQEKDVRCEDCTGFLYKGDDECYCTRVGFKQFSIQDKRFKKPRWCPIASSIRRKEREAKANESKG